LILRVDKGTAYWATYPRETQGTGTPVELLQQYITTTGRTPRYLRIDNAKEFTSQEMEDFCSENGIILQPVVVGRDCLFAEAGIPPLYITQNLQLAQLRFRLHSSPPATIQHVPWQLWQPLLQLVLLNTLETRMQTAVCHVDMALVIPWLAYIQYPWPACSAYYRKTRMTVLLFCKILGIRKYLHVRGCCLSTRQGT